MRKVLTIACILFIILGVLAELVVPRLAEEQLKDAIRTSAASNDVELSLDATPRFLVGLGRIGVRTIAIYLVTTAVAILSIAMKPILCLVFSYCLPGFPRPAMTFIPLTC